MSDRIVIPVSRVERHLHRLGLEVIVIRVAFGMQKFGLRGPTSLLADLESLGGRWYEAEQAVAYDVWSQLEQALEAVDAQFSRLPKRADREA